MTTETKEEPRYLVLKISEVEAGVVKLVRGEAGPVVEARHRVKDGACDCPGYSYRKVCRHLEMVATITDAKSLEVPLHEARGMAQILLREFPGGKLPPEPFDRDEVTGMVKGVTILAPGPEEVTYAGTLAGVRVTVKVWKGVSW